MIPVVARVIQEIPIELIDDPEIAMRDTFDDERFHELCNSIQLNGVQVPLIVERRGERFVVSAGHRRLTACRHLGAATVPCDVREPGVLDAEAIKILENDDRENVNAADAAMYLARLFVERCDNDVDKLCALTKRSRRYVEDRLVLLNGDEEIFAAVKARQISLGVALALGQITNIGYRRSGLDQAIRFGMTVNAAKQFLRDWKTMMQRSAGNAPAVTPGAEPAAQPAESRNVCTVCLGSDHPERMRWLAVHEHCQLAVLEKMLGPWRESQPGANGG